MKQPATITELVSQWAQLITERNDENNERIAYDMVGALAGNDLLWDKWYTNHKEPDVSYIFDNVSDLELPDGIFVKDAIDRMARWNQVNTCILELRKRYS